MPTIFTHSLIGACAGMAVTKSPISRGKFVLLSVFCAILPDFDVVTFKMGIPYDHLFGHRGFFHSIFFAGVVGLISTLIVMKNEQLSSRKGWFIFTYFSSLLASHSLLDAFTNGGLGIALLAPFHNERYFFWVTPISVSPLNPKVFFSARGVEVLKNEILLVWVPAVAFLILCRIFSLKKVRGRETTESVN